MKKTIYGLMLSIPFSGLLYAFNVDELPNEMYVNQHWVSYTTSFDIETKTQKLGSLYRRILGFPLTYDFYDPYNHLLTTARARFFSIGAHFDVYNESQRPLGMVEEKIFTFYPSFIIYSPNSIKLAHAEMNFWGTTFSIYDPKSEKLFATISRPFFRVKNDWTINITNRNIFKASNISPELFMTVAAFQGDREYWEAHKDDDNNAKLLAQEETVNAKLQEKITSSMQEQNLERVPLMSEERLEALIQQLDSEYQAQQESESENTDTTNKTTDFVNFCLNLVQSNDTGPDEKKAILYLLEKRLAGEPTAS